MEDQIHLPPPLLARHLLLPVTQVLCHRKDLREASLLAHSVHLVLEGEGLEALALMAFLMLLVGEGLGSYRP